MRARTRRAAHARGRQGLGHAEAARRGGRRRRQCGGGLRHRRGDGQCGASSRIGTSGVMFVSNDKFRPNAGRAVHAFCHAVPGTWHQMGVILSAAGEPRMAGGHSGHARAEADGGARAPSSPGRRRRCSCPISRASARRWRDAQVRGLIMGLGHESDHKTLTHAALDAVAFAFRDLLEALKDAGTEVKRVTAVGGGSKSELWLKIIATVLGVPVDLPAAGDVGGAFGAARLGLIAATGADFRKVLHAHRRPRAPSSPRPRRATPMRNTIAATQRSIPRSRRSTADVPVLFASRTRSSTKARTPRTSLPIRWYNPDQMVHGQDHARADALCGLPTGTRCAGRAATPSAATPSCASGTTWATRWPPPA